MENVREQELTWYRHFGRFPSQRIVKDVNGEPYVIGDRSWNTPFRPHEVIEPRMREYCGEPPARKPYISAITEEQKLRNALITQMRERRHTLEEIGQRFGISRERVRQICEKD